MGELPLYDLQIDFNDDTGVEFISLVDAPAIQLDWQAFSKSMKQDFEVISEDKQIIAGFAMIADKPIYRRDESGEYNVKFSKETITQIIQKFFKQNQTHKANVMHSDLMAEDTYIMESFQIDSERGILTPKGFEPQVDGSWFVSMKVNSDKVWKQVKNGEFKGFSIEGLFEHVREFKQEQMNKQTETFFNKMKSFFNEPEAAPAVVEEEVKMGEAALSSGTIIMWDGELEVGTAIMVVTEEGNVPAEDGDHELADGTSVIRTEGGKVAEIVEVESMDVAEVMEELMGDLGVEFKALKSEIKEARAEVSEVQKGFTEFKEQTEKDLEAKDKEILKLSEQEIVAPIQKVTTTPKWKTRK